MGLVTFGSYTPTPYLQPKSKCVLNDSEWLEKYFKHVLKSETKTGLDHSAPTNAKKGYNNRYLGAICRNIFKCLRKSTDLEG